MSMKPRHFLAAICAALLAVTLLPPSSWAIEIAPTRLAVMEFVSDEFHAVGSGATPQRGQLLSELLMGELLAAGGFELTERLQLEKATKELSLHGSGQIDPATAAAIGRRIGAQVVVIGTLSEGTEAFVLGRFIDVELGRVMLAETIELKEGSLLKAARDLAAAFKQSDNAAADEMLATARRRAALGQTQAALARYEQNCRECTHSHSTLQCDGTTSLWLRKPRSG